MLRLQVGALRRARVVGMACVILAAAVLLTRPAGAAVVDTGVCTFNLTENWAAPGLKPTPATNLQWWISTPVTGSCTSLSMPSMTILEATGFADAASCGAIADLEGTFSMGGADGNYDSNPLLSIVGGGTAGAQEWVFDGDPEYRFLTAATLKMSNPTVDMNRCLTGGGLTAIAMTATFYFVDESV